MVDLLWPLFSYDATPADYISMIITDYGMVSHMMIMIFTLEFFVLFIYLSGCAWLFVVIY